LSQFAPERRFRYVNPGRRAFSWGTAQTLNFRVVFLQHHARIVAILERLLGDRSSADEVANDAFWRLYQQPELQIDGNVGGWLYRTATNLGIDAPRASGRRRGRLIIAATALLDSGGEGAVTLRTVGHASGILHNAPYKNFERRMRDR
jgi:DNA-directed RNA polymerase specialized sigma24 family protein